MYEIFFGGGEVELFNNGQDKECLIFQLDERSSCTSTLQSVHYCWDFDEGFGVLFHQVTDSIHKVL